MFKDISDKIIEAEEKLLPQSMIVAGFSFEEEQLLPSGEKFKFVSVRSAINFGEQTKKEMEESGDITPTSKFFDFRSVAFLFFEEKDPSTRCHLEIHYTHEYKDSKPLPIDHVAYWRWSLRDGKWSGADIVNFYFNDNQQQPEKARNTLYHLESLYESLATAEKQPLITNSPFIDPSSSGRPGGWGKDDRGNEQGPFR